MRSLIPTVLALSLVSAIRAQSANPAPGIAPAPVRETATVTLHVQTPSYGSWTTPVIRATSEGFPANSGYPKIEVTNAGATIEVSAGVFVKLDVAPSAARWCGTDATPWYPTWTYPSYSYYPYDNRYYPNTWYPTLDWWHDQRTDATDSWAPYLAPSSQAPAKTTGDSPESGENR